MIRINLLPFRAARKKENIRREVSIFLLTFIFTAMVLFYYNGMLSSKLAALAADVKAKKIELAKYNKIKQEINRIKKRLNELKRKTNIINRLNVDRKWPISFLDTMNDMIIEKRMWLTRLQTKGNNIDIRGIALDNKTVADFMTRLEGSKLFNNINLRTVSHKKMLKYNLKSFQISCNKAKPKKAKAKTVKATGKANK